MRITFTRRGDYAVRAMLALAKHDGTGYVSSRRIAEEMNIPAHFAAHVLADLTRAGLVVGSAGRTGGYRLSDPAETITLLRVIDGAEPGDEPRRCVLRGIPCDPNGKCAVHDTVVGATSAARAALAGTSLADLVRAARS